MRYGRLTVQGERRRAGRLFYRVLCECGQEKEVRADNLRAGLVLSCGCLGKERASARLSRIQCESQPENLPRNLPANTIGQTE